MPQLFGSGPRLRFDDGPGEHTDELLNVLAEYEAQVTFMFLGVHVQARPELVRRAHADGHTIGSHAWDHAGLDELSDDDIRAKLAPASALLAELTGERPTLCGPPMDRRDESREGRR